MKISWEAKRYIVTLMVLVALLTGIALPLYASDITNAKYIGTIRVSNNSTAAEAVSVNLSINSTQLIEQGFASANLTDMAIQRNGVDTAFMPGNSSNSSNPWVFWVSSIGENRNVDYSLFTPDVTGGKIRYFPDSAGMSVSDNANMECGDNFTIEINGYFDTTAVGANITSKVDGIRIWVSSSGNITSTIYQEVTKARVRFKHNGGDACLPKFNEFDFEVDGSWVSPSSQASSDWTNPEYVYDDNLGTFAQETTPPVGGNWGDWLELNLASSSVVTGVRMWQTSNNIDEIEIELEYQGSWHDFVSDDTITHNDWEEYPVTLDVRVTASSIPSGEHKLELYADTANLTIEIDDVVKDTVVLGGASVPDNDNDWTFCESDAVPYMEYTEVSVNGTQAGCWEWENSTSFVDLSGNDNTATPTFRTTSSDADVSAVLLDFQPVSQAQLSTYSPFITTEILTDDPEAPAQLYTELDTSKVIGGEAIDELLEESGTPKALWWFPFIFISIAIIGLMVYGTTTSKGTADGSLLTMCIVVEVLLGVIGIMNPIPLWPVLLFPIPAGALILSRKHIGWG